MITFETLDGSAKNLFSHRHNRIAIAVLAERGTLGLDRALRFCSGSAAVHLRELLLLEPDFLLERLRLRVMGFGVALPSLDVDL